jgi:sarcosine oxidase subunit gamma
VHLTERPFFGHLNVRGDPNNEALLEKIQRCLGLSLPLEPNTVSESSTLTVLWLGPNEWLIVTLPSMVGEIARTLRDALRDFFFVVTDVTDGQVILRISGIHAIDVLRKGCVLDLHPRIFKPGCCAQTLINKVGVLIRAVDYSPSFDLMVRRSFSEYLAHWLKDAATEYSFAVISNESTANNMGTRTLAGS